MSEEEIDKNGSTKKAQNNDAATLCKVLLMIYTGTLVTYHMWLSFTRHL